MVSDLAQQTGLTKGHVPKETAADLPLTNDSSQRVPEGGNEHPASSPDDVQDALPVWSQMNQSTGQVASQDKKIVISAQDFNDKKKQLSDSDKLKLFNTIASLPVEEIQKISEMIENGLTVEDLEQLQNTLKQHLKQEDYEKLLEMISTM